MKAEQRKQLEKNELADRLARWWKGADGESPTSTLWLGVGVVVLVIILIVAWRYYREASLKNRAAAWKQLELAMSASDLDALMEAHRGNIVGRMAKAQLARLLLNEGLNQLGADLQRTKAIENIERARDLYRELAEESRDDDALRRESLLSAGKAEESLVGVPGSDSRETRGSLETALEWYDKVASQFPESPEGRAGADRAKSIRENRDKIKRFYEDLAKRYRVADEKPKPGTPGGEPAPQGTSESRPLLPPPAPSEPTPKSATPNASSATGSPLVPPAPPPSSGAEPAKPASADPPQVKPVDEKKGGSKPAEQSNSPGPTSDSAPSGNKSEPPGDPKAPPKTGN